MILEKLENLERAEEVLDLKKDAKHVSAVLKELKEDLESREDLVGLTAPQIGYNERIIALKFEDGIRFFINPLYVFRDKLKMNIEPWYGKHYLIPRFEKIEFGYTKPNGVIEQLEFNSNVAFIFQQLYEVLEGLQPSDYGVELNQEFFEATDEERQEVIDAYADSLVRLSNNLKQEIEDDPILREQQHTIDFLTSVAMGETKIAKPLTSPTAPKMNRAMRRAHMKEAKKLAKLIKEHTQDDKQATD